MLLDAVRKQNRNKNRILFWAVTFTVSIIFCILSFANGKLQTDIQKNIYADGMTASGYIEEGTENIVQQLNSLAYISETGKEKFAGKLLDHGIQYCECVVAEKNTFKKMLCPAYTEVIGHYPEKENEIMLSTKTLRYIGINDPKPGMEVELDFYWNDIFQTKGTGRQKFVLSGYFTEYQNQDAGTSIGFLSEKKLDADGIGWEPCRILVKQKNHSVSGMQMEQRLKDDLYLEKGQRIVSMDPAAFRAVNGMLGSYGAAAVFSLSILACMFLFVYNILNLSLEKDLQQYGLMEVIGVQPRQIIRLLFWQMTETGLKGCFAGGISGSFLVLGILPYIIKKMYMDQMEGIEYLVLFRPVFLLIAVIPTAFTFCITAFTVKRKLKDLSPLECMNYQEESLRNKKQGKLKQKKMFQSWGKYPEIYLAKRYLFRRKKAFLITMISLAAGCGLALCSSVLVRGVDVENRFLQEPDFRIYLSPEVCSTLIEKSPDTENMVFFPDELLKEINNITEGYQQNENRIQGFYPIVGTYGRDSIKILDQGEKFPTVIQKVSPLETKKLQRFLQQEKQNTDWETFIHGKGTILVHDHRVSEDMQEKALNQVHTEIQVYDLVPVGTDMTEQIPETLVNCGYLDITEEAFPNIDLCWKGQSANILLVTENTWEYLSENLTPQIFELQFHVKENREPSAKNRLKQLLQNANMKFQSDTGFSDKLNLFQIECKSDLILKEQNYIQTSRFLLGLVSGCLIFIGVLNFLHVRITDILMRKKECMTMENIGMTKKQLCRMFLAEGLLIWGILCGVLLIAGSALAVGIYWYMKTRISYFVFHYPAGEMIFLIVMLLLTSAVLPAIFCRKIYTKQQS